MAVDRLGWRVAMAVLVQVMLRPTIGADAPKCAARPQIHDAQSPSVVRLRISK